MKRITVLVCCLVLTLSIVAGLAGCANGLGVAGQNVDPGKPSHPTESAPLPIEPASYKLTPDTFDENLLQYIASVTEGSYMVSPLSFRYALGLLLAGASGDTKTELISALGVASEEEWEAVCLAFNDLAVVYADSATRELEQFRMWKKQGVVSPDDPEPSRALQVANSVWKRKDIPADFTAGYRDKIEKSYAAEYFTFTRENAVKKINTWADEKTKGLIPELLPADYDTSDLAVVLMNALYYKNSWKEPFPEHLTEDGDFTLEDGAVITKSFMKNEERFVYYEDEATQLVVIPMKDGVYMAYVLGSTENLGDKLAGAKETKVRVTVPKIDLETSFDDGELVSFLKACSVNLAFDPRLADFSVMLEHQVWVDDIIQKTRLKTDETGVEAAAVTAIMIRETSVIEDPEQSKVFTADRPFSFYIYTTVNDVTHMMFAGKIVD